MDSKLTKEQAIALGKQAVDLLNITVPKNGLIKTKWGIKSLEGLGRSIERLVGEVPLVNFNARDAQGETFVDSNIKLVTNV